MTHRSPSLAAALVVCGAAGGAACSEDSPGAPDPPVVCEGRTAAGARGGGIHRSQCGPAQDFIAVNRYDGELTAAVAREDAVVLINGSCTGTLIAAAAGPVVLTAGHCIGLGERAVLAFNLEERPDGDPLVTNATAIERSDSPDYALLQLDQLPAIEPTSLTSQLSDRLAVIQHPRGRAKVIAEGDLLDACDQLVYYVDLDTLVGSSGAGVLTRSGYLTAIHTDGDCGEDGGGSNRGWSAASIVEASAYLQATDLADR